MSATNSGCAVGAGVLPSAPMDLPRGPLLALTSAAGTLFGADDEPRAVGPQPDLWRLHGAGSAALTVVLLDERHQVRLRREGGRLHDNSRESLPRAAARRAGCWADGR